MKIKAILLKNFYCLLEKQSIALAVIVLLFWVFLGFMSMNISIAACFMTTFIAFTVTGTGVFADKQCGWNKYICCTSVSFSKVLLAQYIFTAIMLTAAFVIELIGMIVLTLINGLPINAEVLYSPLMATSIGFFMTMLDTPLSYKFSAVTSSVIKLLILVVLLIGFFLWLFIGDENNVKVPMLLDFIDFIKTNGVLFIYLSPFAMLGLNGICWLLFRKMRPAL